MLSSTVSAGDFSRCLQKYDVDTSPYLKSFFFDNERPDVLVRPKMRGAVILPDDEPAFVGVLAVARLVLRLQRARTTDDAVLNFDGSFSSETIERGRGNALGRLRVTYDEGITPRLLSETDEFDQRYLCFRFPSPAFILGDFFLGQWQCSASVLVATGGVSCAFCSPAGLQLGTRDLRSPISTGALPWAARYFNAAFADFENVLAIATADHGSVLPEFSRARARRRGHAVQLDAPHPSRSPTRRGSTPRAARGRRRSVVAHDNNMNLWR